MKNSLPLLALALLAASPFASSPAQAAQEDIGAWHALNATADLNQTLSVTMDAQLRFSNDISRLGQYLIRPNINYKLGKSTTLGLGYAYFHTDPVGPAVSDEHRIWQQATFRLAGDGKGITITGRSRVEQRWIEGSPDIGLRLRQQLRLTGPLSGKVRGVAWSEAFIALNDTKWGQNSGVDRWRNFAGVNIPLSKSVSLEPGYLNQWAARPAADLVQHNASLTLWARF